MNVALKTILHPTAMTPEDRAAEDLAAALAWRSNARLVSVHACEDPSASALIPDMTPQILRWADDPAATFTHERVVRSCCEDVIEGLLVAAREFKPELIVTATHPRSLWGRLLHPSVAETLAAETALPTCFLPQGAASPLDAELGTLPIRRILIAAQDSAAAAVAAPWAAWLAELAAPGVSHTIEVWHRGEEADLDDALMPELPGWTWAFRTVHDHDAALQDTLASHANRAGTVVIMPTHGHDGWLDFALGSITERVLHHLRVPLLAVPWTRSDA